MKNMVDSVRKILTAEIKWLITLTTIVITAVFAIYNPINEVKNRLDLLTQQVLSLESKTDEVRANERRLSAVEKDIAILFERCGIER